MPAPRKRQPLPFADQFVHKSQRERPDRRTHRNLGGYLVEIALEKQSEGKQGLGSDPFETPTDHNGYMIYIGARYSFKNEDRTKVGFEFNHGSKYWFNFAQAQDDIIAPKTNTRGDVLETYLTHRLDSRFIIKADYIYYNYKYSGSGWHIGAPKLLTATPVLGFPTYKNAQMFTVSTIVRF